MAWNDEDDEITDLVDDFTPVEFEIGVDNAKQICDAMLFSSLNSHRLYGAFEPASCELVNKVDPAKIRTGPSAARLSYMDLEILANSNNYDPEVSDIEGEDWVYPTGLFSGTLTTENLDTPFTADELGGTIALSVKAAAELKAYHEAAGGEPGIVEELFCSMYGLDEIELDPITPVVSENFSGRAISALNKSHHAIHGHSTDTARIRASFDTYTRSSFPGEVAIDWARIIVSFKYNGILNAIYDRNLSNEIAKRGIKVKFAPPINSWPIIPKFSMKCPALTYEKETNLAVLKESINNANLALKSEDIYLKVISRLKEARELADTYGELGNEYYEAAMKLAIDALARVRKRSKIRLAGGTEIIEPTLFLRSEDEIYNRSKEIAGTGVMTVIMDVIADNVKKVAKNDSEFLTALLKYRENKRNIKYDDLITLTEELWRKATQEPCVLTMIDIWEAITRDRDKAIITITKRLSYISEAPINLSAKWPLSATKVCISRVPVKIYSLLVGAYNREIKKAKIPPEYPSTIDIKSNVKSLHDKSIEYFMNLKTAWAHRYDDQITRFKEVDKDSTEVIKYQLMSSTFKNLDYTDLMDTDKRYFKPYFHTSTSIYKAFRNYIRKRKITTVTKDFAIASSYSELGNMIDLALPSLPDYSFLLAGQHIESRLDMLFSDIKAFIEGASDRAQGYIEDFEHAYDELKKAIEKKNEPTTSSTDLSALLASLGCTLPAKVSLGGDIRFETTEISSKATFDSDEQAESYAKYLGFKDYSDWYAKEGKDAQLDDDVTSKVAAIQFRENMEKFREQNEDFSMDNAELA